MSGQKLEASYTAFLAQLGAHAYARRAALRQTSSPDLLVELGMSVALGTLVKDRRKAIQEHFERVGRQIRRQGFVDLVSAFEADLFRLLGMATSKARHVLKQHYDPAYPWAEHRDHLARTPADIANLGGYKRLLASSSPAGTDFRKDLWDIVAYRDYLAHGERWAFSAGPPGIDLAYHILSEEIRRIEAVPA